MNAITQKMVQTLLRDKSAKIVAEKENTVLVRDDSDYYYSFKTVLLVDGKLYWTDTQIYNKDEYEEGIVNHQIKHWNKKWCEKSGFITIYRQVPQKRLSITTVCFFNNKTKEFEKVDIELVSLKHGRYWCFDHNGKMGFGCTRTVKYPDPYDRRRRQYRQRTDIYLLGGDGKLDCVMEDVDMDYIISCYKARY